MTMQVYLVEVGCWLGGTSGSAVAVGTGLRSFALAGGAPVPVPGMTLRVERAAAAGTYMTGIVVAASEAGFTMQVQATGGSGTHSDWVCTAGTLRFSSGRGMTTSGADTPPHVRFDPRLRQALEIRRDMFDRGTTGGRSRIEYGELVLANPDGAYDRLLDYGFDARRVTVRVGQEGAPFPAAFPVVLVCTAERIIGEGATLTLRLRTRQAELDRPIQRNRYGGTNSLPDGLDGTPDDLQGRARPLVFGQVANITPLQVNTARLIWQVNDGSVQDIPAVYDGGFALTRGADYADQADMEANPPASGTYRAWLGGGYFALGDSPAGEVTADAVQGASAADRSIARIVAAIVTGPGEIDPGDVVTADIDAMHAAFSAEVCCYVAEDRSIADVLDDLCASGGM
ncbi:hypothetical protein HB662_01205 [Roseomonas frigidaquae]|uniref:Uncharacterized protein n=1 Tax=Falsiroseomonas frigidaquae TaxID=487318 RepID=A0ABX1ETH6_9PROT|nr:hypothetical protein [Falsiroseomonas frigidaquae]NKE43377.1 hypothetical protein [Falsiroseomonas frigidaquae]